MYLLPGNPFSHAVEAYRDSGEALRSKWLEVWGQPDICVVDYAADGSGGCFASVKMERAPPAGLLLARAFPSAVVVVARQGCLALWVTCCCASGKTECLGRWSTSCFSFFPSLPTALPPWLVGDFFLLIFSSCRLAQEQVASTLVAQPHINFSS